MFPPPRRPSTVAPAEGPCLRGWHWHKWPWVGGGTPRPRPAPRTLQLPPSAIIYGRTCRAPRPTERARRVPLCVRALARVLVSNCLVAFEGGTGAAMAPRRWPTYDPAQAAGSRACPQPGPRLPAGPLHYPDPSRRCMQMCACARACVCVRVRIHVNV